MTSWAARTTLLCILPPLLLAGGCVHPNIPSVRNESRGVALSPLDHPLPPDLQSAQWVGGPIGTTPQGEPILYDAGITPSPRIPGGRVECQPEDPAEVRTGVLADYLYGQGTPKEPDVPWPRFHPLPTRPVL